MAAGGSRSSTSIWRRGSPASRQRERELRAVLDNRQFEIWYQPIYRLANGRLEGLESLLRWRRMNGAIGSICDLLDVAEDTGLSMTLGCETLDAVCRMLRRWSDRLPQSELTVSVNMTHRQFYHPDMVTQISRATGGQRSESGAAAI